MIKATMFCVKSRQLPMLQVSGNCFFPFNPSLQEELKRLFTDDFTFYSYYTNPYPNVDDVMEEFRHNGRDFEYCPDVDDYPQPVPNIRRKKPKKPLPNVCVFCRNNGVEEIYYRQHLIKYADGRVQCPVLSLEGKRRGNKWINLIYTWIYVSLCRGVTPFDSFIEFVLIFLFHRYPR
uniref:uncharacterized protein LOC127071996 isoform X2 n=1 Tax=Vespula vulgaris TaxID=7454 RepID=UPI00223B2A75|nr:uncharacterized protein LOC127071996 isoform X2 [Vespula vulgaris]